MSEASFTRPRRLVVRTSGFHPEYRRSESARGHNHKKRLDKSSLFFVGLLLITLSRQFLGLLREVLGYSGV